MAYPILSVKGLSACLPTSSQMPSVQEDVMAGMMEGKVVVVTGSGGGIGREIALAMAAAGAKVIVADIGASLSGEGSSATPAQQTKQLIEQKGGAAEVCTESVAEWGSAQKIIQAALDHYGRIDGVVNNAGILRDVIFHRMAPEEWLSVIGVHLNGCFFVSRAAAEHYRKQESGTFVHISSTSGLIGNFGQANYSAAKLGITALSKSIALDMRRYNVRLQLHRAVRLEPHDAVHPRDHARTAGAAGEDPGNDAGQECTYGGVPVVRCCERRVRPGVRHADERDHPVQFAASDSHRASR
jgi:NAD(P)-dependent dehydrogenase (short-subunit alcohol dehydrogenase family)